VPEAQTSLAIPQETQVKHQLIEGYLPFAKHLAITLCPPSLYQRLLPDLVGAVNLAVVEATMRCDLGSTLSLDAYVAAYVRGPSSRRLSRMICSTFPFGHGSVPEQRVRSRTSTRNTVSRAWTR
jgi:DNA-directed RNA polymerase specialized sigma subunit